MLCFGILCQFLTSNSFQLGGTSLARTPKRTFLGSIDSRRHDDQDSFDSRLEKSRDLPMTISRRSLGRILAASFSAPALARAADDDNTPPAAEIDSATTYSESAGSFRASNAWEKNPGGGFKDRFTGRSVVSSVRISASPTTLSSMRDLGKVENVKVADKIPSLGVDDLIRGDLIAASVRTDSSGIVYYAWDLALAPTVCKEGEQFGGALGCSYDRIYLIAAAVKGSNLNTCFIQATAEEWKGHGIALRRLRDSFLVPSEGSA